MNVKKKDERKILTKEEFEELKDEIKELKKYYDENDLETKIAKNVAVYLDENNQTIIKYLQNEKLLESYEYGIDPFLDENYQLIKEFLENEKLAIVYEDGIDAISDKIQKYDLSKIPFKAYKDFYNLGFNFNGTNANINFRIMQQPDGQFMEGIYPKFRYKSCDLRNLKVISRHLFKADDNSFDREVVKENFKLFKNNKNISYINEIKEKLAKKEKEKNNINQNNIPEDEKKEIIQNLQTLGLNKESNIEKHNKNIEENNKESKEDNDKSVLIEDEIEI